MEKKVDPVFLFLLTLLILFGFFAFVSAAMGLLARDGAQFSSVLASQAFFGLVGGGIAAWLFSKTHYRVWQRHSVWIFPLAIVVCLLVFAPHIGFEHGGAKRWVLVGPLSFQPAELLKFASIIFLAMLFAHPRIRPESFRRGLLPFTIVLGICTALLLTQPDMGTYIALSIALIGMYFIAGGKWRHLGLVALIGLVLASTYIMLKPHALDRIQTFIDPSRDPSGASWQIQQSFIAIGSGGVFGKGFGQSVQKFGFLPEPMGDSIFAVIAEEFGIVGSVVLIALFAGILLRGLYIARRAPDTFSGLVVSGIVIMLTAQAFLNMSAAIGVFPLTGIPLPFVSHGGTALFVALAASGIVLNVSRYIKRIS